MSNLKKGRALVIHVGDDETRVACLSLGAKTPQLLDQAVFPTSKGAVEDGVIRHADELREQLFALMETRPAFQKVHQAVFVLQSTKVLSQTVTVPRMKRRKQVEQLVRTNADLYFPVDAADYHITWQVIGELRDAEAPMTRIQLWAAPKSLLEQYYRLANGCGLTVAAIDDCGHSFAAGIHASFVAKPSGRTPAGDPTAEPAHDRRARASVTLYIHLEKSHVLMSFVEEEQVLQQRLFRRSERLELDLNEIFLEMEYFYTMFSACVGDCVVSGSGSGEEALLSGLAELTAAPLRRMDEADPIWCMTLGAGATELDFGDPGMNIRGAGSRKRGNAWQNAAVALGGVALAAAVLLPMSERETRNAELTPLRVQQTELMLQLEKSGSAAGAYRDYDALYEAYRADWETLFAATRTYNDNLCLILEELEAVLPRSAVVTQLDISEESLSVETAFQSKEDAAYFLVALRNLQYATLDEVSDLTPLKQQAADLPQPSGGNDQSSALLELLAQLVQDAQHTAVPAPAPAAGELQELLTEPYLKAGLQQLTQADLSVLDKHYVKRYEMYTLRALLADHATLSQRKAALHSLLETDPLAMRQFFLLLQEDGTRTGKDNVLTELIRDDLQQDPDLRGLIYNANQALPEELMPRLVDVLVQNRQTVTGTEELIRTHYHLTRKLAGHLAAAMGKGSAYVSGMDFSALRNDILSGKTWQDPELDAVVRRMLTPAALTDYENLQTGTTGQGSAVPERSAAELLEQVSAGNAGGADRKETPQELPGNFSITVTLGYKETLILAEQARKGLDRDAMVQKVEVAE